MTSGRVRRVTYFANVWRIGKTVLATCGLLLLLFIVTQLISSTDVTRHAHPAKHPTADVTAPLRQPQPHFNLSDSLFDALQPQRNEVPPPKTQAEPNKVADEPQAKPHDKPQAEVQHKPHLNLSDSLFDALQESLFGPKSAENPPPPEQTTLHNKTSPDFRERFRQWEKFHPVNIQADGFTDKVNGSTDKLLVYTNNLSPGKRGVRWAELVEGVVSAYVIAGLTGRRLKAEFPDCVVSKLIAPNRHDWRFSYTRGPGVGQPHRSVVDKENYERFKLDIHKTDLNDVIPLKVKVVYFKSNLPLLQGLVRSEVNREKVPWMRNLTHPEVFAAVYKHLFRLVEPLQARLDEILADFAVPGAGRLVCADVTMGKGSSRGGDSNVKAKQLAGLWAWLGEQLEGRDKLFLTGDDPDVITSARNQGFADRLIVINGEKEMMTHEGDVCEGYKEIVLKHHLLMNCDLLVRGQAGLGVMAAYIRGSDSGLFCLQAGNLTACTREE